ncbi:MAG: tryptophan--tRNA ligase [Deltaproteobacteria bacterium]|nr:tryptophan--tRNA ligase [Deltaproteobacteria bacterium]
MRPSGKLHLGHFHGVLENWLELQKKHECFFFVADWHALTTEYEDPSKVPENTLEMVLDWLSVGIDPVKSVIFTQSGVKEHAELYVLLSMLTPLGWLERNPTYKEQLVELKNRDVRTYGFLGYPVLQTADIIVYQAGMVPVGIDQAPHIELSREIVRRFNHLYGEVFPEPKTLLTEAKKVLGTDGRKMSKSYDNSIYLSDTPEVIEKKMRTMVTDTARQRKTDPGNPEKCPFFETFHKLYSDESTIEWVHEVCTTGAVGCIECKQRVIPKVLETLEPIQKKRAELEKDKASVMETLKKDTERARIVARETMEKVRSVMSLG